MLGRLGPARFAAVAVLAGLSLLGWIFVVAPTLGSGKSPPDGVVGWLTGDFGTFYVAGEAVADGRPLDAYDRVGMAERVRALGGPSWRTAQWSYPPTVFFLVAPMGMLPGPAARLAWTLLMTFAAAAAAAIAARDRRVALLALPFPGLQLALAQGQVPSLVALALAPAVGFADRRPILAGAALGCLALKPHLALGPALVLLGAGRVALVAAAAAAGLAWVALATAAFGIAIWPAFLADLAERARDVMVEGALAPRLITPFGVAMAAFGTSSAALAAHALAALIAIVAGARIRRLSDDPAARGFALAAAAVTTPTLGLEYDLALFLLPVAAWLGDALRADRAPGWGALALAAAALLAAPAAFACWFLTGFQPAALVVLAALLLTWARVARAGRDADRSGRVRA